MGLALAFTGDGPFQGEFEKDIDSCIKSFGTSIYATRIPTARSCRHFQPKPPAICMFLWSSWCGEEESK